ncbi:hypothetical protein BD626DRAFT_544362 [Schizophyllum amplum]|uniref:Mitochondrial pyruvate carrier n=1 Tax=Schizophyllum amplum TaxID=97359 RepID=A0A550CY69_9AGAR|nr:hypothetical protein BD626DRAFT_544362 [Auriculariopsis ampla]
MAAAGSKFQAFLNHPAGPKTVFFWAPLMKWALVAAGLKDLSRPAEKLSVSQNVALTATGIIWVRYSLVITPVNYSLAAVNFFVGLSGLTQLVRVAKYVLALSPFPAKPGQGIIDIECSVHLRPTFVGRYTAHDPVVDPIIAKCDAVKIHMKNVQCPLRRLSLRLLLRGVSSSTPPAPENAPIAFAASPVKPPFS